MLLGLAGSPGWWFEGLCAQTDPELFFPEKGGSVREAKAVCAECPVRVECLEYALAHGERFGVWGGLSERERRRLQLHAGSAARVAGTCERQRRRAAKVRRCNDFLTSIVPTV